MGPLEIKRQIIKALRKTNSNYDLVAQAMNSRFDINIESPEYEGVWGDAIAEFKCFFEDRKKGEIND